MLANGDASGVGGGAKAASEPPRLQRAVRRMEDRAAELRPQMRQLVAPLGIEPVLVQRFVFQADLVAFLVVGSQAQAACAAEGVSGNCLEPVEYHLGALPQLLRRLRAICLTRD